MLRSIGRIGDNPEISNEHGGDTNLVMEQILHQLFQDLAVRKYIFWYYTPMALPFSRHLEPMLTVYDCMDELSAFKFAPPALLELKGIIVKGHTGIYRGQSLYEHKKSRHRCLFTAFPAVLIKTISTRPGCYSLIPTTSLIYRFRGSVFLV
ncbi:hypothetical protein LWM68_16390 [Niabella sp. W65]|nr:hypothetical protein [Niabella sp. W65]MCH7364196.1 hypothetical protein [Niabella sp. W65]